MAVEHVSVCRNVAVLQVGHSCEADLEVFSLLMHPAAQDVAAAVCVPS